jgi:hypothetical protein
MLDFTSKWLPLQPVKSSGGLNILLIINRVILLPSDDFLP